MRLFISVTYYFAGKSVIFFSVDYYTGHIDTTWAMDNVNLKLLLLAKCKVAILEN